MEATVQVQVNTYSVALDYHRRWSRQATQGRATGVPPTHWHNAAP
jgi:hypothetical protein